MSDSLYDQLNQAGCKLDHHESDLYVKQSLEATRIITDYETKGGITNQSKFVSQVDGEWWIELPFHFKPFWDQVSNKSLVR